MQQAERPGTHRTDVTLSSSPIKWNTKKSNRNHVNQLEYYYRELTSTFNCVIETFNLKQNRITLDENPSTPKSQTGIQEEEILCLGLISRLENNREYVV